MSDRTESIVQILNTRNRTSHASNVVESDNTDPATNDDYTPFALGRVSSRPQMMLVLKKCTGEVTAYAYSLLTKVHAIDPSKGFTLTFGDAKIQIDGNNLSQLFSYVCQHRAVEIIEADRSTLFQLKNETLVSTISASSLLDK